MMETTAKKRRVEKASMSVLSLVRCATAGPLVQSVFSPTSRVPTWCSVLVGCGAVSEQPTRPVGTIGGHHWWAPPGPGPETFPHRLAPSQSPLSNTQDVVAIVQICKEIPGECHRCKRIGVPYHEVELSIYMSDTMSGFQPPSCITQHIHCNMFVCEEEKSHSSHLLCLMCLLRLSA